MAASTIVRGNEAITRHDLYMTAFAHSRAWAVAGMAPLFERGLTSGRWLVSAAKEVCVGRAARNRAIERPVRRRLSGMPANDALAGRSRNGLYAVHEAFPEARA